MEELLQQIRLKYPGVKLWAFENAGRVELQQIEVPSEQRGSGIGTEIMRLLQDYARLVGKPIVLRPEPDRGKKAALERFYKRLGFVNNAGRHKDYSLSTPFSKTMYWRFKEWLDIGQFLRENKMLAVDIESLLPHKDDMEAAVHSLQNSRPSTDRNPIEVWATGDGRFVVVNGHHRLLQVILRGEESKVQVTVTGQANSISGTVVLDFYDGDFYGLDSSLENGWLLPRLRSY